MDNKRRKFLRNSSLLSAALFFDPSLNNSIASIIPASLRSFSDTVSVLHSNKHGHLIAKIGKTEMKLEDLQPYKIIRYGRFKIGVASHDPLHAAELKQKHGCDMVVCLAPEKTSKEFALNSENVDLIISDPTHKATPAPAVVRNKEKKEVFVSETGPQICELNFTFDAMNNKRSFGFKRYA